MTTNMQKILYEISNDWKNYETVAEFAKDYGLTFRAADRLIDAAIQVRVDVRWKNMPIDESYFIVEKTA